jgi:hypothetical protein
MCAVPSRKAINKATFQGRALLAPVVGAARDLVEQLSLVSIPHSYFWVQG